MVVWSCGFGPEATQFMRMVACIEGGCSPQGYQEVRRRRLLFQYPLQGHSANDLLPPARPRLLQVPNASQKYHRLVTKSLVYMGLKRTLHVLLAVVIFSYFPEWAIIFFPSQKGKNKQEYRHTELAGMWGEGHEWRGRKGWFTVLWRPVRPFIPKL